MRKEADGIRRYVHLGTGNYNDSTAKLYTDTGMFTCRDVVGEDATAVFNMLSGYSEPANWNRLIVAPIWMKKRFLEMIHRETKNAKKANRQKLSPNAILFVIERLSLPYTKLPVQVYRLI